ncbi:MAG: type II secretion system protein N [Pseudomonadota bacterium]
MNMRKGWLLFAGVLIAVLIAAFPLRLALGAISGSGALFTARAAEGSIWNGTLRDVSIDGVSLGDFSAKLSALKLLGGAAAIQLRALSGEPAAATLVATFGNYGADNVTTRLVLPGAFDPLPVESVDLKDASVRFSKSGCVSADGQVRVTLAGISLGQQLLGTPRCDGNILSLALVSQSAMERIILRIVPDGQYSAKLLIRASDAQMAGKLNATGFRETPEGHFVEISGRF